MKNIPSRRTWKCSASTSQLSSCFEFSGTRQSLRHLSFFSLSPLNDEHRLNLAKCDGNWKKFYRPIWVPSCVCLVCVCSCKCVSSLVQVLAYRYISSQKQANCGPHKHALINIYSFKRKFPFLAGNGRLSYPLVPYSLALIHSGCFSLYSSGIWIFLLISSRGSWISSLITLLTELISEVK